MSWTFDFLSRYLRIPSVSAQGTGIHEAVQLLSETFRDLGCDVRVLETERNPVVFAERRAPGASKTLLVYNHYDVQPAEPLDEWLSPAFEPTVREGNLFARGTSDNKGNLAVRLGALREMGDRVSVNLKFTVEGEEEVGSPSLPGFVKAHADLLKADACLWESGGKDEKGAPDITCGVKGILHVEVVAKGPSKDLHSSVGVVVPNPGWTLAHALAGLRSLDGRVTLPGFHDRARKPDAADRKALKSMPYGEAERKKYSGIDAFVRGLTGEALKEALIFEPTININGLTSGYQGKGSKTVLPKVASAKLDCRLVPDMEPADVLARLKAYFGAFGIEVHDGHGYPPARTPVTAPVVKAAVDSAREVYAKEPILQPLMAASGPMYLYRNLMPVVAFGAGAFGSNIHAPNEFIVVDDLPKGERHFARFLELFAKA